MKKAYFKARKSWVRLWVVVIVGAMIGVSGTAQAMTTSDQGFYGDAGLAAPRPMQPEQGVFSSTYLLTHIERNRSTELQPMPSGTGGDTITSIRCPAFASWEDWGGARVHAYVDFRPNDLCNGRHVRAAYVRLIRQCGPYFDTGRIYTYTASSPYDTALYSVSAWILDSPLWWCNTNTYYGYDYF
jgi:hypothetical protein